MTQTGKTFPCYGCGTAIPVTDEEYDYLLEHGYVKYCDHCRPDVSWAEGAEFEAGPPASLLARLGLRVVVAVLGLAYGLLYPFWWLLTIPLRSYADLRATSRLDDLDGKPSLVLSVLLFLFGIILRIVLWPVLTIFSWVMLPFAVISVLAGGVETEPGGPWDRFSARFG